MDEFKQDLMQGEKSSLIRRVANQNKALKEMFDQEVLSKQNEQIKLQQMYKPITAATLDQTNKIDTLFQQLHGKHDRSSRLLSDIIGSIQRGTRETKRQGAEIISAIVKQPLLPELIKELNKQPTLVKQIMQSETVNVNELNSRDRKALESLNHLNDEDLRTLIKYYNLQQSKSEEEQEEGYVPPTYSDIVFQDIAPESSAYKEVMATLQKRKPGLNDKAKHGTATVSPIFYYDANDPDTVKFSNYNVQFKENKIKVANKEYILTQGLEMLLNRTSPTLDEKISENDLRNYLNICIDAGLDYRKHVTVGKKLHNVLTKLKKLNELDKDVQVVGNGLKTVILPDNVSELQNRLAILLGEYKAGNKSTFNEINAVLDMLLKRKAITKTKISKILCLINGTENN